ncbi:cupin domain-containing protein [Geoglobus acetivorans]|uniref:Cupin domain-containing protein n=1 Tax=Geoglobus acetivorans TaxID=565033 RepID=A0ABZ3H737_GEOAI|nr:cupin domain-containing protein [Geoglobus acetivorans]
MKLLPENWEDRRNYRVAPLHFFDSGTFIQLVEIKGRVGRHYHKTQTEVFVVVEGSGKIGIGDEVHEASCGDVFLCQPRTIHFAEGNLKILVFKYDYVESDTVWLE